MLKKIKKFLVLFILLSSLIISSISFAHSGRTDSNGGHYDRSTGEYHYHTGESKGQIQYKSTQNTTNTQKSNTITKNTVKTTNTLVTQKQTLKKSFIKEHPVLFSIGVYVIISIIGELIQLIGNKPKKEENNVIVSEEYKVEETKTLAEPPVKAYNPYICPKCGGQLQIKSGKYGLFIGCKNYPRCKYTRNIKNNTKE